MFYTEAVPGWSNACDVNCVHVLMCSHSDVVGGTVLLEVELVLVQKL